MRFVCVTPVAASFLCGFNKPNLVSAAMSYKGGNANDNERVRYLVFDFGFIRYW